MKKENSSANENGTEDKMHEIRKVITRWPRKKKAIVSSSAAVLCVALIAVVAIGGTMAANARNASQGGVKIPTVAELRETQSDKSDEAVTPKVGETVKVKDVDGKEVEATVNADGTVTTANGRKIGVADVATAKGAGSGGTVSQGGSSSSSTPTPNAGIGTSNPGTPSTPATPEPVTPTDPHAGQTWVVDYVDGPWVETSPAWEENIGVRYYEGSNGMRWYNEADIDAYLMMLSPEEASAFSYTVVPDIRYHEAEGYYEKVPAGGHWE